MELGTHSFKKIRNLVHYYVIELGESDEETNNVSYYSTYIAKIIKRNKMVDSKIKESKKEICLFAMTSKIDLIFLVNFIMNFKKLLNRLIFSVFCCKASKSNHLIYFYKYNLKNILWITQKICIKICRQQSTIVFIRQVRDRHCFPQHVDQR